MKNALPFLLILIPAVSFSQTDNDTADDDKSNPKEEIEKVDYSRISFIVGPGASYITRDLYETPVINQTNNLVMLDKAKHIKSNIGLGITYTPYIQTVTRLSRSKDGSGRRVRVVEVGPRGITGGVFANAFSLSKAGESQSFFSMPDFGIGLGHRYLGGLVLLGTIEFFSVRQPRPWFVNDYKSNDKAYMVGGAAQKAIDVNDNTIFTNIPVITIGFKVCYSFDVIKSYISQTQALAPPQQAPPSSQPPQQAPPASQPPQSQPPSSQPANGSNSNQHTPG